ncbi:MAG: heparinase, partial [Duncaniella sp.]|nr:heparinase [Duncaniella sp.]
MNLIHKMVGVAAGCGAVLCCAAVAVGAAPAAGKYWNDKTHLVPMRLPLPPAGFRPEYVDLDGDGRPDAIKSMMADGTPILWLDDDGNMTTSDMEGDMVNDCLLVDVNRDGKYGGHGDLIIDWVDEDGDGHPDMQIVINYPEEGVKDGAHYMIVRDLEHDNAFNYI